MGYVYLIVAAVQIMVARNALLHRFELYANLNPAGQRRIRCALQGMGQRRMADQPDADQM